MLPKQDNTQLNIDTIFTQLREQIFNTPRKLKLSPRGKKLGELLTLISSTPTLCDRLSIPELLSVFSRMDARNTEHLALIRYFLKKSAANMLNPIFEADVSTLEHAEQLDNRVLSINEFRDEYTATAWQRYHCSARDMGEGLALFCKFFDVYFIRDILNNSPEHVCHIPKTRLKKGLLLHADVAFNILSNDSIMSSSPPLLNKNELFYLLHKFPWHLSIANHVYRLTKHDPIWESTSQRLKQINITPQSKDSYARSTLEIVTHSNKLSFSHKKNYKSALPSHYLDIICSFQKDRFPTEGNASRTEFINSNLILFLTSLHSSLPQDMQIVNLNTLLTELSVEVNETTANIVINILKARFRQRHNVTAYLDLLHQRRIYSRMSCSAFLQAFPMLSTCMDSTKLEDLLNYNCDEQPSLKERILIAWKQVTDSDDVSKDDSAALDIILPALESPYLRHTLYLFSKENCPNLSHLIKRLFNMANKSQKEKLTQVVTVDDSLWTSTKELLNDTSFENITNYSIILGRQKFETLLAQYQSNRWYIFTRKGSPSDISKFLFYMITRSDSTFEDATTRWIASHPQYSQYIRKPRLPLFNRKKARQAYQKAVYRDLNLIWAYESRPTITPIITSNADSINASETTLFEPEPPKPSTEKESLQASNPKGNILSDQMDDNTIAALTIHLSGVFRDRLFIINNEALHYFNDASVALSHALSMKDPTQSTSDWLRKPGIKYLGALSPDALLRKLCRSFDDILDYAPSYGGKTIIERVISDRKILLSDFRRNMMDNARKLSTIFNQLSSHSLFIDSEQQKALKTASDACTEFFHLWAEEDYDFSPDTPYNTDDEIASLQTPPNRETQTKPATATNATNDESEGNASDSSYAIILSNKPSVENDAQTRETRQHITYPDTASNTVLDTCIQKLRRLLEEGKQALITAISNVPTDTTNKHSVDTALKSLKKAYRQAMFHAHPDKTISHLRLLLSKETSTTPHDVLKKNPDKLASIRSEAESFAQEIQDLFENGLSSKYYPRRTSENAQSNNSDDPFFHASSYQSWQREASEEAQQEGYSYPMEGYRYIDMNLAQQAIRQTLSNGFNPKFMKAHIIAMKAIIDDEQAPHQFRVRALNIIDILESINEVSAPPIEPAMPYQNKEEASTIISKCISTYRQTLQECKIAILADISNLSEAKYNHNDIGVLINKVSYTYESMRYLIDSSKCIHFIRLLIQQTDATIPKDMYLEHLQEINHASTEALEAEKFIHDLLFKGEMSPFLSTAYSTTIDFKDPAKQAYQSLLNDPKYQDALNSMQNNRPLIEKQLSWLLSTAISLAQFPYPCSHNKRKEVLNRQKETIHNIRYRMAWSSNANLLKRADDFLAYIKLQLARMDAPKHALLNNAAKQYQQMVPPNRGTAISKHPRDPK